MTGRKRWTRILVGSIAALVLAVGVLWGFALNTEAAAAQAQPEMGSGELMLTRGGPGGFGRSMGRGFDNGSALLANALGITEAELQAAHLAAAESALDQAVADGLLTEDQAAKLKERGGIWFGIMHRFQGNENTDALLAEALGISEEELGAACDSMIEKGVEAGLLTEAQGNDLTVMKMMRDAASEAIDTALKKAVEAGLITQEQADNLLGDHKGGFRGFGGFDHPRGFDKRGGMRDFGGFDHERGSGGRGSFPGFRRGFDGSQFETPDVETPDTSNL